MDYRMGVVVEGERFTAKLTRNSFCIEIDDFRDDPLYVDPQQQAEWLAIEELASLDLKDVARCALDTMPDIACSAIASALGLKLHSVIGLSNGRRNKDKRAGLNRGVEFAEVTREELIENYRAQFALN